MDTNGRWSLVADGHLVLPQMAIGHLGLGSNIQSSTSWSSNLMIGHLSLGLNGHLGLLQPYNLDNDTYLICLRLMMNI